MVWLVQELMRWLVVGIRVVVVGPPSFQSKRSKFAMVEVAIPQGNRPPFQMFTYGDVTIRAWRNWSASGEIYFNLDLVRQVGQGRLAKSFRTRDLDDVGLCVYKMRAWLRESNTAVH